MLYFKWLQSLELRYSQLQPLLTSNEGPVLLLNRSRSLVRLYDIRDDDTTVVLYLCKDYYVKELDICSSTINNNHKSYA